MGGSFLPPCYNISIAYIYMYENCDMIYRGDKMGKTSAASKNKYAAKTYDRITTLVKKGEKETIKAHAESKGMSLNAYINDLIEKDMKDAN